MNIRHKSLVQYQPMKSISNTIDEMQLSVTKPNCD